MSTELRPFLNELVPVIYDVTREELNMPLVVNMAESNQCNYLTLNLYQALEGRNMSARRELHVALDSRSIWHYVINHSVNGEPTEDDVITDLNPWQFDARQTQRTFLHGPRHEVQDALQQAGAPEYFVALRGLQTIYEQHTEKITPFSH